MDISNRYLYKIFPILCESQLQDSQWIDISYSLSMRGLLKLNISFFLLRELQKLNIRPIGLHKNIPSQQQAVGHPAHIFALVKIALRALDLHDILEILYALPQIVFGEFAHTTPLAWQFSRRRALRI